VKIIFNGVRFFVAIIIVLIFLSAISITGLGVLDLLHGVSQLGLGSHGEHYMTTATAIGILEGVDTMLVAIVLFIFSYGLLVVFFASKEELLVELDIPNWLRMRSFHDLKIVLWEAVLTTLVIGFLIAIAQLELEDKEAGIEILFMPVAIALIAISLYLLKKDK